MAVKSHIWCIIQCIIKIIINVPFTNQHYLITYPISHVFHSFCLIRTLNFDFRFKANDPGTHFWHAHAGLQRTDGIFGSFVIRQPRAHDPHSILFDDDLPEHTIMLNDWMEHIGAVSFAAGHHAMKDHFPTSILINGKKTSLIIE